MNDEDEVITIEVDTKLIYETTNHVISLLQEVGSANYPKPEDELKHIFFVRNVIVNILGNFILSSTNHAEPNALNHNIELVIEDILEWFKRVKKIKKEAN